MTGGTSDESGDAGTPEPTTDREPPETDPELKDAGEVDRGLTRASARPS